jgi:hypothetical protein
VVSTNPSEKYVCSSVGMIFHSQYHGKVIQNSMVPVTTNQTTFGPSNLTPLDTEKENTATWDDLS